ncbi:MAG TPA: Uma2 family endonuclease [Chitinophagaceae bacterium]|nr:Uma2 family endonuclease [Chitinophagaceae bacterium]
MKEVILDKPFASEQEYFLFEEKSELKHEYINGTLFEMSGTSKYHNFIVVNLVMLLKPLLAGTTKQLTLDGYKVRTPDGNFFYPGIAVSETGGHKYYTDEPILVVEVLSGSTRRYDLSDKFIQYRKCPSLQYYLCVEPAKRVIYFYHKADNNEWVVEEAFTDDDAVITLPALNIALQLKDIYNS